MLFFIELRYFEREAINELRRKIFLESTEDVRWVEWLPSLGLICEEPDLTLIGPQCLGWGELSWLANAANGRQVVLIGSSKFTLGLQALPQDFTMHELYALMPWDTQERANVLFPHPELDYKRTMPLSD